MRQLSRRQVLHMCGATVAAAGTGSGLIAQGAVTETSVDLARYVDFGAKVSGGPGDQATGAWLEGELKQAGFVTRRLPFSAPFFEPEQCEIVSGSLSAPVVPQGIVVPTPPAGVTGPMRRVFPGVPLRSAMTGGIALIELPYNRWSSALAKPVRDTVGAALAAGAIAAVVVTNGPSRQAIALNADGRQPSFAVPVAIIAPKDADPFLAAADRGDTATLHLTGRGGRRPAYNVVGELDRGRERWIIVSTPRSGWFDCAGERGGGVAAWCALARWAPAALPGFNLLFLCNSGHEYEYLGAEHAFDSNSPGPAATALWLHLGANVAARDWQELTGTLLPLPSADPERYLVTSPMFVDRARQFFKGQPGLEAARATGTFAAGELTNVLAKGYLRVFGIFGAHRFHHTALDDKRCLNPAATEQVIASLKSFLSTL